MKFVTKEFQNSPNLVTLERDDKNSKTLEVGGKDELKDR